MSGPTIPDTKMLPLAITLIKQCCCPNAVLAGAESSHFTMVILGLLLRPMLRALGQAVVLLGDAQQFFLEIVAQNYVRLGPRLLCPIVPVLRVQKNAVRHD
jgi:hypothetical protein